MTDRENARSASVLGPGSTIDTDPMPRPKSVAFVVPIATHSKLNQRIHWAVRAKENKAERRATWAAARGCWRELVPLAAWTGLHVVTLTRISPRLLDDDNLRGSLKAVRDEVAALLRVDDRDPSVRWDYAQQKGKPARVLVSVEAVP